MKGFETTAENIRQGIELVKKKLQEAKFKSMDYTGGVNGGNSVLTGFDTGALFGPS